MRKWRFGRERPAYILVEGEGEHVILRIARFGEGARRGNHELAIGLHAAAVVNEDADRDRRVLMHEETNGLDLIVFEHAEGLALEAVEISVLFVSYRDIEHNQL